MTEQQDSRAADEFELEFITDQSSPAAQTFLRLGPAHMAETAGDAGIDVMKFLQSCLRRLGEPNRWMALFVVGGEPAGFTYFKVDRDDRPGWGYVMEFYVVPAYRRHKVGTKGWLRTKGILEAAGCTDIWLSSHPLAEGFWKSCGLLETGQMQRDQKILAISLHPAASRNESSQPTSETKRL